MVLQACHIYKYTLLLFCFLVMQPQTGSLRPHAKATESPLQQQVTATAQRVVHRWELQYVCVRNECVSVSVCVWVLCP